MKALITALVLAACSYAAVAQEAVETAPLQKLTEQPKDTSQAILITAFPAASYMCPKGFDLYVQRVRPKDSKDPESAFKGFFWIAPPDPKNPSTGMVTSRPGNEVTGACFKTK